MAPLKLFTEMFSDSYTDEKGYKRYKDSNKPVHRAAAEKKLGRKLHAGEVVHHKNRNKQDNSQSNLWVFKSQSEHDKAHKIDAKRKGKFASYKGFKNKKKNSFWDIF